LQVSAVMPQLAQASPATPQLAGEATKQVLPLQQPVRHDWALQPVHMPALHTCPMVHAAPPPHLHMPPTHWLAAAAQFTQIPPPVPHAATEPMTHTPLVQHPVGHDTRSHTHIPMLQCCPTEQMVPPPQVHDPLAQPSARTLSQTAHDMPIVPHLRSVGALQVAPRQHPCGQLALLQMHNPPLHVWPIAHGGPLPHVHWPALHVSVRLGSHATQATPPVPQFPTADIRHMLPEQQPLQVCGPHTAHTPLAHSWPCMQGVHMPPAEPQFATSFTWHTPAAQHPMQVTPSHTHCPITQWSPSVHAEAPPQRQLPPPSHESAVVIEHAVHAPPWTPHAISDGIWHILLASQQPLAQLCASHTHWPPAHRCPVTHAVFMPHWHTPAAH
jgi:hypothetical protein